jgi:predicted small lipoprotein YifL
MKNRNIKNQFIYVLPILVITGLAGCGKEFLERPPEDRVTADNYYQSYEDLRNSTAPLYNIVWFDYNERAGYSIGDIRSNNLLSQWFSPGYYLFTVTSLDYNLLDAWSSLYKVIAQSNSVMCNIATKATGVTEEEKNAAIAECRFMRGTSYFHLVRAWGPVMIIEDNVKLVENPIIPLNPIEDVYKLIIKDLKYASRNLPETDEAGRLTRWSAEGMLAKVYLAFSGYGNTDGTRDQALLDSAKYYAADVCNNSGLQLMENYEDLFKYKYNVNRAGANNQESLFSLLWVPLGPWGASNVTLSDFAFSSDVVGGVSAWGSHRASYDILTTYKARDIIRLNATFMTDGVHYPEINQSEGGYTYNDTSSAPIKKYVPGGPDDNEGMVATMNSPLNTYILRLADVYLVYAEACLGNSPTLTSGEGWHYFHMVRNRAGMDTIQSITFEDIMYERRIELAMEYQYWYDMVTWYYFKPDYILNYINNQERGTTYTCPKNPDGSLNVHITDRLPQPVVATAEDMYFPYPESEIIQNPYFNKAPVPYNFGD